jgi:Ribophorin I
MPQFYYVRSLLKRGYGYLFERYPLQKLLDVVRVEIIQSLNGYVCLFDNCINNLQQQARSIASFAPLDSARRALKSFNDSASTPLHKMKPFSIVTVLLSLASASTGTSRTSKVTLPTEFQPPQVFKNVNLVHVISLEKIYVKEQINVQIQNIAEGPQDEYFLPFTAEQLSRVGGLEVKDRKDADAGLFTAEIVKYDSLRSVA